MLMVVVFTDDRDNLRWILKDLNYIRDYAWSGEYFVLLDGFQDEWKLGVLAWVYELSIIELDEAEMNEALHYFEEIPGIDYLLECMNGKS
jgi:hypothetical protein